MSKGNKVKLLLLFKYLLKSLNTNTIYILVSNITEYNNISNISSVVSFVIIKYITY